LLEQPIQLQLRFAIQLDAGGLDFAGSGVKVGFRHGWEKRRECKKTVLRVEGIYLSRGTEEGNCMIAV
jgi:hypothetical protein